MAIVKKPIVKEKRLKYLKHISPKLVTINLKGDNLFKKDFNYV